VVWSGELIGREDEARERPLLLVSFWSVPSFDSGLGSAEDVS